MFRTFFERFLPSKDAPKGPKKKEKMTWHKWHYWHYDAGKCQSVKSAKANF